MHFLHTLSLLALAACAPLAVAQAPMPPRTVAEASDYRATSRHADVTAFCEQLAGQSNRVRLGEMGTSGEGRKIPLVVVADPPVTTPEQAARSGKLVVLVLGNIHAGEVDGKEALLMLARDLALAKERPLLNDLVVVFAPLFNADGNERISRDNRKAQNGPADGVGVRANAAGLDLNRDFVKLESPEVRALVRAFAKWDPAVFVDCHTTNGSYHRYAITYEGPRCPGGDRALNDFVRESMLPDVSRRIERRSGYKSFFYGNFAANHTLWETVPATPRYGIHYAGLRNCLAILSESYNYSPYKERVLASRDFVRSILEYTAENKDKVRTLVREAKARAQAPRAADRVALRQKAAPLPRPVEILGFVEETKDGRRVNTGKPREYQVQYQGLAEPTLTVSKPYAYLVPASYARAVETLQRHGVEAEELREDRVLKVEAYRVAKVTRKEWRFQNHQEVALEVEPRPESRRVPAGTVLVQTGQPLGNLAAYLLEPQSDDGLATWNFFDEGLAEGKDFPVLRLPARAQVLTTRVRPLKEDRTMNKPLAAAEGGRGGGGGRAGFGGPLAGAAINVTAWLDDGEHYLLTRAGRLMKVNALTGDEAPFYDPAKLAAGLAKLPGLSRQRAESLANGAGLTMNPQRTGGLFTHENDLYYSNLDGTGAVRLTKTPGEEELEAFSPDGKLVAFVRANNLYVVDVATQTERALTADGSELIANGKPDWVYGEEVFDRRPQGFWWSPDSTRLAFLRFDDTPVHKFTVLNAIPVRQRVETTPYPKAGDPNPVVKLGLVAAVGGPVHFADLSEYTASSILLLRAGWTPDGERAYFYVTDRAQTWLDVCTTGRDGGEATRLLRDTTKAWVNDPGPLHFLKDGSFLMTSERSGYNHLYHFDRSGKLIRPLTSGEWEMNNGPFIEHALRRVDEANGWAYLTGHRDSAIATNLYRVRLDGTGFQRLTPEPGDHRVLVSPKANLFVDSFSSHSTTPKVLLRNADGSPARTLDTNPVHAVEEYRLGKFELVKIKAPDGFPLEASVTLPSDFDPKKKYPVWLQVYGGPDMPTIRDTWQGGRVADRQLADEGYIVFRVDPRSSSNYGGVASWTAYRQLGVQELKDLEAAVKWLAARPYVDPARVGISGHSYGGYMTAFALTHSKLFACGISGAPVTDWKNYDTIYTERYMNTPQENPDGYDKSSVVRAARNLSGRLLLIHGVMDDNVHVQNALQLVHALQQANKDFDLMVYPQARHGVGGAHYQRLTREFMKKWLKPEGKSETPTTRSPVPNS